MARVLGLDLAERVGWAVVEDGRRPQHGYWDAPKELPCDRPEDIRYGRRAAALRRFFTEQLLAVYRPDAVAAEAPLIPNKFSGLDTNTNTVLLLSGFVFVVEMAAYEFGIADHLFMRVHNHDAKIALCGKANGIDKTDMKEAALAKFGCYCTKHDEADAIGVALHAHDIWFPA